MLPVRGISVILPTATIVKEDPKKAAASKLDLEAGLATTPPRDIAADLDLQGAPDLNDILDPLYFDFLEGL